MKKLHGVIIIKYVKGFILILSSIFSLAACSQNNEVKEIQSQNTISYGLYNQEKKLIDVGTSLTMSDNFSGSLEIKQDSESDFIYYLNILNDGNEINYRVDGKEHLSATEILLSKKESVIKALEIPNLVKGSEVEILLFKYPVDREKMTVDTNFNYSVMGLRYNVGDQPILNKLEFKVANESNEYDADFVLLENGEYPPKIALNQNPSSNVNLLIGKNLDQQEVSDRNYVLGFLNGRKVEVNGVSSKTIYQVDSGKVFDLKIELPSLKQVEENGDIFQMVSILSPNEMSNGIESQTNINFTNPILIKRK